MGVQKNWTKREHDCFISKNRAREVQHQKIYSRLNPGRFCEPQNRYPTKPHRCVQASTRTSWNLVVKLFAQNGCSQLGNVNLFGVLRFVVTGDGIWDPRYLFSHLVIFSWLWGAYHGRGSYSPWRALCCSHSISSPVC